MTGCRGINAYTADRNSSKSTTGNTTFDWYGKITNKMHTYAIVTGAKYHIKG
jgi:hypothetical protein